MKTKIKKKKQWNAMSNSPHLLIVFFLYNDNDYFPPTRRLFTGSNQQKIVRRLQNLTFFFPVVLIHTFMSLPVEHSIHSVCLMQSFGPFISPSLAARLDNCNI